MHRVFLRPFKRLSKLEDGKGLVGVEKGVYEGDDALCLFKKLTIDIIFLIDSYEMYQTYINGVGKNYGRAQLPLSDTYIQAQKVVETF